VHSGVARRHLRRRARDAAGARGAGPLRRGRALAARRAPRAQSQGQRALRRHPRTLAAPAVRDCELVVHVPVGRCHGGIVAVVEAGGGEGEDEGRGRGGDCGPGLRGGRARHWLALLLPGTKRLRDAAPGSASAGSKEFEHHMAVLGGLRHPNVVPLNDSTTPATRSCSSTSSCPTTTSFSLLHVILHLPFNINFVEHFQSSWVLN
jgi:hypothetical protein